jgi:outer membrane protein OmpA-like peptidoglycan-associated protein
MNQKYWIILCLMILTALPGIAQSLRSYEKAGDQAFAIKDYATAFQHYKTVVDKDADNYTVWWKYAETARHFSAYQEADRAYSKVALSKKVRKNYPLLQYNIGKIKQTQGEYTAAVAAYETFLSDRPKVEEKWFEKAKTEIEICHKAQKLALKSSKAEITHLPKAINSPYSDFAPIVVGDTLFYSSYRFEDKKSTTTPKNRLTKVMISSKGGRGREPGRGFPATDTAHIAHTAFSPDGHYIFYTVCKNDGVSDINCELWLTVLDRRNRWMKPMRLPEPVNMPGYTTTQPSIGYDPYYQGAVLWFSSNRPGGKGKMDLWYMPLDTNYFCECNLPFGGKKLDPLPDFDQPINAAALNTEGDDITPFFFAPTKTLYFSTDSRPGLGGFDIFSVEKAVETDEFVGTPENVGPGLNSSYNDIYFYLQKDGLNGYLSSNRPGSYYIDEKSRALCNDLYSFKLPPAEPKPLPKPEPEPPVVVETPRIPEGTSNVETKQPPTLPVPTPAPPVPVPMPPAPLPSLEEFVGLPLYFDNDEPDRRTERTFTKKSYEETALTYLARQDWYRERMTLGLKNEEEIKAANMTDDFFENEVRKGYDRLNLLCDVLLAQLQAGQKVEVVIKGFTSPRARTDYNLNLGRRRISSVRNHLATFSEGVLQPYLTSGALKISEASFGETVARKGVSDNLKDERNSIYHPDAARERRVEIVGIMKK